jgi:hypothetical protein
MPASSRAFRGRLRLRSLSCSPFVARTRRGALCGEPVAGSATRSAPPAFFGPGSAPPSWHDFLGRGATQGPKVGGTWAGERPGLLLVGRFRHEHANGESPEV